MPESRSLATIIDGRAVAARIAGDIAAEVERLKAETLTAPGLAVVLVGDNPASRLYVGGKSRKAEELGFHSVQHNLPASTGEADLLALIEVLNRDPLIHGILIQFPLPPQIDKNKVIEAILPEKDVDGFHPVNVGRLSSGTGGLVPCTPLGCMMLLDSVIHEYRGLAAVVIGKSNIVGKPVAMLLLERECTVTVTHIATRGLSDIVRTADIVIAAAGAPRLVRGDWVKPGAVVIDVGITRVTDADSRTRLVGDTAFDELGHARAATPVPGGVGPMTIACLLANTVRAARAAASAAAIEMPDRRVALQ